MAKKENSQILKMRRKGLTAQMEDYVKVIYTLQQKEKEVTTQALAEAMKVRAPSATSMMKKLASWHLVEHTRYQGVRLTPAGEKIALEILRHHRLLELYLARAMGYSWDEVHQEAERLEHFISEDFEDKMSQLLGNPEWDPHGSPIPSKSGAWSDIPSFPLAFASENDCLLVQEVEDEDQEFLRYLGQLGLYPGVEIQVKEKHPFHGPLCIGIGNIRHYLGYEAASRIRVARKTKQLAKKRKK